MNLCRCERGHFFDKEKYATCPHCAKGFMTDDSLTTVFTDNLDDGVPKTESLDPETPAGPQVIPPVQIPPVQIPPVTQDAPFSVYKPGNVQTDPVEDDDQTVAFYDDIFSPHENITDIPATSPVTPARTSPVTPKVNTPCVGWLVVTKGMHLGQDYHLKVGKNFIGRDSKMDIVLDGDKSVSRNKHAIVVYEPKQHLYLVQPGESSELVYLNDAVVLSPMQLKAYDVITVGEVNLVFMPFCSEKFNWTDELKKRV